MEDDLAYQLAQRARELGLSSIEGSPRTPTPEETSRQRGIEIFLRKYRLHEAEARKAHVVAKQSA